MSKLHKKTVGMIKQMLDAGGIVYKETEGASNEGDCTSLQIFERDNDYVTIDILSSIFELPRED